MNSHTKKHRDAYTFSLNGMRAVGGYISIPVVADDRLDDDSESHQDAPVQEEQTVNDKPKARRSLWRRRKAA